MPPRFNILLAEDDAVDVELLTRAFKDAGVPHSFEVAPDGQAAIDFLREVERRPGMTAPALVLLDMKMPRRNGLEVLQWIRQQDALRCVPVFMFSASALASDVEPAYALGANIYLVKPSSTVQRAEIAAFINDWLTLHQPSLAVTQGPSAALRFRADWIKRHGGNN
ncbi:MAG TPA: response regulator [Opitutaceae bacterium]|nr:response regulator [Opitutaceae bacterium]